MGCRQAVKVSDFDSDIRVFESHHPSQKVKNVLENVASSRKFREMRNSMNLTDTRGIEKAVNGILQYVKYRIEH